MSIVIAALIMLGAGLFGGFVNYLLPANTNPDSGIKVRGWFSCIILGTGATILVPLFLEIAQSRLLDKLQLETRWLPKSQPATATATSPAGNAGQTPPAGGAGPAVPAQRPVKQEGLENTVPADNPLKSYFLFGAYCLLAAAAGFRFIDMIVKSVIKDKELAEKSNKIEALKKEKKKREEQGRLNQKQDDQRVRQQLSQAGLTSGRLHPLVLPGLPPVTHPEDPQKGRFGGQAVSNHRALSAEVAASKTDGYYTVALRVDSLDKINHPLGSDVIFYLHDSFSPSVFVIPEMEFNDGAAVKKNIPAYGAFTVGAAADNGETLLELDLAEDPHFPAEFRNR